MGESIGKAPFGEAGARLGLRGKVGSATGISLTHRSDPEEREVRLGLMHFVSENVPGKMRLEVHVDCPHCGRGMTFNIIDLEITDKKES